ncbi:MAG TPA: ATP-grasp domain-containing protein [Methylobacter sp.]|jgi:predicted ATP-grasp superfamily ATP-dependent carboligase
MMRGLRVIQYCVLFYSCLLSIVKILVFEYITGGGFNKQELPDSLADEGRLMLKALLDNLVRLPDLEVTVMMDWRLNESINTVGINTVIITPELDITEEFTRLVKQSDLVWPIAPEFDGILQTLCQTVELVGKILLTAPSAAVAIAGNKFKTHELLNRHQITSVPTRMLGDECPSFDRLKACPELVEGADGEWIVKPVDGVGCAGSYVITNRQEFEQTAAREGEYIIQPHLQGTKTSLSCLFKQGRGWLVCANLQHFDFINQRYQLADIVVNHHQDLGVYQSVITEIAQALPELWGYVGIDLIETAAQTWVLEINPRLTTSFVGIYEALGINIAESVLQLVHGEPALTPVCNRPVMVQAKQEAYAS